MGRATRLSACVAVLTWVAVRVTLPAVFERYTEKARRTIFFARYEASQFGSAYIETEHLLLGLLREDRALGHKFLGARLTLESLHRKISQRSPDRDKISTSIDLPLSNECKRILAYAAEEADLLRHKHLGTEHLLLGMLREEKSFAAETLQECRLSLVSLRQALSEASTPAPPYSFGSISTRVPRVEFLNEAGEPLAVQYWSEGMILPRLDEYISLPSSRGRDEYSVGRITYYYLSGSSHPFESGNALFRIEIILKKFGANESPDKK